MPKYNPEELLPAVAYYRYSPGGGQTEQSIEGQRRDCMAYAKSHGYVIVKEYIDRHLTGRNDKRPAFQLMMQDAETHCFERHRKADQQYSGSHGGGQLFQSCLFSAYNTGNRTITPRKTAEKPAPCKTKHHSKPC